MNLWMMLLIGLLRMPKRLTKREYDDVVYGLWQRYLCQFGAKQAKRIIYAAYKTLREQEREYKKKK